nr:MAG TPA: Protein of unknown function (DUF2089) [Caudoviricetes sp.]DAY74590.1 MAG TPA: Protein of unknown function (DUF2089) [Caudoviricetes sp.]
MRRIQCDLCNSKFTLDSFFRARKSMIRKGFNLINWETFH